jgi:hypothetical protein
MLVDKQTRLESELLVAVAIARETLSTLRRTDPQCAARCAKALLSSYNMYRNNRDYPNLSDLLDTVARCSLPAEGAPAGGRAAITGELVVPPTRAAGSRSRGANPQRLR